MKTFSRKLFTSIIIIIIFVSIFHRIKINIIVTFSKVVESHKDISNIEQRISELYQIKDMSLQHLLNI